MTTPQSVDSEKPEGAIRYRTQTEPSRNLHKSPPRTSEQIGIQIKILESFRLEADSFEAIVLEQLKLHGGATQARIALVLSTIKKRIDELPKVPCKGVEYPEDDKVLRAQGSALLWLLGFNIRGLLIFDS